MSPLACGLQPQGHEMATGTPAVTSILRTVGRANITCYHFKELSWKFHLRALQEVLIGHLAKKAKERSYSRKREHGLLVGN